MSEEILAYHAMITRLFAGLLLLNLVVPSLFGGQLTREILATRLGFYFYAALLSMVIFTGLILYLVAGHPWRLSLWLMVAASLLLIYLEIRRVKALAQCWYRHRRSGASVSWRYVAMELLITACMIVWMVAERRGALPLSS
jgi:hypothetical protein